MPPPLRPWPRRSHASGVTMPQAWSLGGLSAITHQGLSWCQRQHSAPTSLITMTRRPFTGSGKGVQSEGWPPRFFLVCAPTGPQRLEPVPHRTAAPHLFADLDPRFRSPISIAAFDPRSRLPAASGVVSGQASCRGGPPPNLYSRTQRRQAHSWFGDWGRHAWTGSSPRPAFTAGASTRGNASAIG